MTEPIAIVGLACRYPDAGDPLALWETVLARRQAFRPIPPERLPLDEYGGTRLEPDVTYGADAAVLTDWAFDRTAFRVARSTWETVDPSHWLALECAARALEDAGFTGAAGLPRETTAVVVGNTLTGDYSRAAALRLRWPFARRALAGALRDALVDDECAARVLERAEARYKGALPAVNEEALAGWLANTIAGRICNHFDFGGGGYVVDGACSSSLLAVATACDALRDGRADAVLAGGVDLSLDPFELVGFAKAGALAAGEMRVYDRDANGFIPGEGCGFAVLMRARDARARARRVYALVRGWGVSSDGHGGITRPDVDGQRLSLARAYGMAGFGIDSVQYFEGHGTGTAVGDATELAALEAERRAAGAARQAVIGSVKANIGHTKAAAGMAGLIKAALAVHTRTIPPTSGCDTPHAALMDSAATLRIARRGEGWPDDGPVRASVSAMGFGGINVHVAMEAADAAPLLVTATTDACLRSYQDCEVVPLAAASLPELLERVRAVRRTAARLSRAELIDFSVTLQRSVPAGRARAAVVVSTPGQLAEACARLEAAITAGRSSDPSRDGIYFGERTPALSIGFLFPGQASPSYPDGGAWSRRFAALSDLYAEDGLASEPVDGSSTLVAQPAIVRATVAGLRLLRSLGVDAAVAVGHSLGELCALHWSGVLDEAALLRLVAARAGAMATFGEQDGAMLSIAAAADRLRPWLHQSGAVIAAVNGPRQTVVSGSRAAVRELVARCHREGLATNPLRVSHAFHSPGMRAAAAAFADTLAIETFEAPRRPTLSTVTGRALTPDDDVRALLRRQLVAPVLFADAIAAAGGVDLWIEVGPGRVLTGLASDQLGAPVIALDAGSESIRGLLTAAAAAFCGGHDLDWSVLARDRFARPFDPSRPPAVLISPCEAGRETADAPLVRQTRLEHRQPAAAPLTAGDDLPPVQRACAIVAARAELPVSQVSAHLRLLSDLHLNSISAAQVVVDIARALSMSPPPNPSHYADASIEAIVEALTTHDAGGRTSADAAPAGVAPWVKAFSVEWREEARAPVPPRTNQPTRVVALDPDGPMAADLRAATAAGGPGGTIVCGPDRPDGRSTAWLLGALRDALESSGPIVLVQRTSGGAAAARSAWLEAPDRDIAVINVDSEVDAAAVLEEARACRRFTEVRLSGARRCVPLASPIALPPLGLPLDGRDVVLVSGGGKGITAECALELAKRTGAHLAILGRTVPSADAELTRNLERMKGFGIDLAYVVCDVTDATAVRSAVSAAERQLGRVTAILHGAGVNAPHLLHDVESAVVEETVVTKVDGLRHLLAAIDPAALRVCIGFGSLIARTGMRGDGHYAAANELMAQTIDEWGAAHPSCRCVTIEWSVWAGAGMGQRLNALASLEREGIVALTVDQGIGAFHDVLASPVRGRVAVTGRFPHGPTLRLEGDPPPILRFLERPLVWYPGVEIVCDADIARSTDLYLDDHQLGGDCVFPAVLGLEAMAQAAVALTGAETWDGIEFERVAFERPIVVPADGVLRLRIAALRGDDGWIDAVLRCGETQFAVDHYRARCRFRDAARGVSDAQPAAPARAIPDASSLYTRLLFQRGRFERVRAYAALHATGCSAELAAPLDKPWFSAFLPADFAVADPGGHDATLHAVQACVPESRLLPVAVERVWIRRGATVRGIRAVERACDERTFTYDITASDEAGRQCAEWRGARFHVLARTSVEDEWVPGLLAPVLERAAASIWSGDLQVFVANGPDREATGRSTLAPYLAAPIVSRPDGRPAIAGEPEVRLSVTHDSGVVLGARARGAAVACDLQVCTPRAAADWIALLGPGGWQLASFVSHDGGEPIDLAATRIWSARECLTKAGLPLHLTARRRNGAWTTLDSAGVTVLTRALTLAGQTYPVIVALLVPRHTEPAGAVEQVVA